MRCKIPFFIAIATLLNYCNYLRAQENKLQNIVSVSTFSPTFSYAPRWNVGYFFKINNRFYGGIECGYGNYNITIGLGKNDDDTWLTPKYKIVEFKPELLYILNPNNNTKMFVSNEFFFLIQKDQFSNEHYNDSKTQTYYSFDSANYKRLKFGTNINFGLIINITRNIGIMPKMGIGIKFRNVEYSNILNGKEDPDYDEDDSWVPTGNNYLQNIGNNTGFNIAADIKIFYTWQ